MFNIDCLSPITFIYVQFCAFVTGFVLMWGVIRLFTKPKDVNHE